VGAWLLVTRVPAVGAVWGDLAGRAAAGGFGYHFNAFLSAVFGFLIGGLWIWGLRIIGTLCFGKEAMGLGDVHILAAVGAVCGWIVPSLVFFLSAFLAVIWAIAMYVRRQREMPYGPWLAAGTLVTLLFYDGLLALLDRFLMVGGGRYAGTGF
jgi:leader peptidase (prepilin peptidase)/N-methyltransferase